MEWWVALIFAVVSLILAIVFFVWYSNSTKIVNGVKVYSSPALLIVGIILSIITLFLIGWAIYIAAMSPRKPGHITEQDRARSKYYHKKYLESKAQGKNDFFLEHLGGTLEGEGAGPTGV